MYQLSVGTVPNWRNVASRWGASNHRHPMPTLRGKIVSPHFLCVSRPSFGSLLLFYVPPHYRMSPVAVSARQPVSPGGFFF
jgi:hypothetical protein